MLKGLFNLNSKKCTPETAMCPVRFTAEMSFANRVMEVTKEYDSHPHVKVIVPKGAFRREKDSYHL